MICCSLQHKTARQIKAVLQTVEMAEIRLDLCRLSDDDIEDIFSGSDTPLVATCRTSEGEDYRKAEHLLTLAIRAGAQYADLEIEAPKPVSKRIALVCAEYGTSLIRSYHNFDGTPPLDELRAMVDKCRHHDGEIVKIVTMAHSIEDVDRLMDLYKYYTAESLIAFAMGPYGGQSRIECLRRGAPLSYSALNAEDATAPGQLPYGEMSKTVYGGREGLEIKAVRMPSSKSYAQRAILAAALSDGVSTLRGYTPCDDSENAIRVAQAMGAVVTRKRGVAQTRILEIKGIAASVSERGRLGVNVGESGLLARLMLPLGLVMYPDGLELDGCGTLLKRPLQTAANVIEALGGKVSANASSLQEDLTLPCAVKGPAKPGYITIDGSKSSQIVSGALMALPLCSRNSTLHVNNPVSIPYIYITMDILRSFGIKIRSEMYGGRQLLDEDWSKCTEIVLKIKEGQRYKAAEIDLEGDWSAASVFLAAGAVFGRAGILGLDTSSLQADLTMMDILVEAGASVSQSDISGEQETETGEPKEVAAAFPEHDPCFKVPEMLQSLPNNGSPDQFNNDNETEVTLHTDNNTETEDIRQSDTHTGVITVQRAPLRAIRVDLSNCPDLFPVTAVFCAFCQGRSSLRGVRRLTHKESDRASGIVEMLTSLGVTARIKGDDLLIDGESLCSRLLCGRLLRGGRYSSGGDHRMVMALRLAELGADSPIEIDDTACVAKSFAKFNDIWNNTR